MSAPMPANFPDHQLAQAELTDLRWVADQILTTHDRSAASLAERNPGVGLPTECPCTLCRHSRPWVGVPAKDVLNPEEDAAMAEMEP